MSGYAGKLDVGVLGGGVIGAGVLGVSVKNCALLGICPLEVLKCS